MKKTYLPGPIRLPAPIPRGLFTLFVLCIIPGQRLVAQGLPLLSDSLIASLDAELAGYSVYGYPELGLEMRQAKSQHLSC